MTIVINLNQNFFSLQLRVVYKYLELYSTLLLRCVCNGVDYFIATNINVCNVVFMMVAFVTNCYVSREFIAI